VSVAAVGEGGLVELVASLLRQNLEREPARRRLLRPGVVAIRATDAEREVTLELGDGAAEVRAGGPTRAQLRVAGDSVELLELLGAPLRLGLPDPLDARGRAALGSILARRIRVRGLLRHPILLTRVTRLLSAT
jgi:hypothetical protein